MPEELKEYVESFARLRVHAQGVAVREADGRLGALTEEERKDLGVWPPVDFSQFFGQQCEFGDSPFILRLLD
jgi:hypothetical protein